MTLTQLDLDRIDGLAGRLRESKAEVLRLLAKDAGSLKAASVIAGWIWDTDSALADLTAMITRIRELEGSAAALEQQAVQWKGEAMAHKSSLHEAYQVLTDATGEPGNWNGARPFRDFLQADRDVFAEWLRSWVQDRFGKMIRHETVWAQYRNFDSERRRRARTALQRKTP